jgi:hypothetical protein
MQIMSSFFGWMNEHNDIVLGTIGKVSSMLGKKFLSQNLLWRAETK